VAKSSNGNKEGAGSASSSGRSTPTIGPKTLERAAAVSEYSGRAVQVSNKTAQSIMTVAGRFGDRLGKATGIQRGGSDPNTPPSGFRGALNRSLVAASSIWDSVDQSAQRVLEDGGNAASKVIRTKYGDDAAMLSKSVGQTGKSVFLIYRDVSGVRRKTLLKVAGSGVIKARTRDGQEVQVQLAQSQALQSEKQRNDVAGTSKPPSYAEKS
jgi:spartin